MKSNQPLPANTRPSPGLTSMPVKTMDEKQLPDFSFDDDAVMRELDEPVPEDWTD